MYLLSCVYGNNIIQDTIGGRTKGALGALAPTKFVSAHGNLVFKPRAPGSLKLLWSACQYACVCVCVCVCVCPPPRPLITSGVIWCDIGLVQLVKQVLRLPLLLINSYGTCRH